MYIGSKYRLSVYLICNNRYRPWKTHIGRPLHLRLKFYSEWLYTYGPWSVWFVMSESSSDLYDRLWVWEQFWSVCYVMSVRAVLICMICYDCESSSDLYDMLWVWEQLWYVMICYECESSSDLYDMLWLWKQFWSVWYGMRVRAVLICMIYYIVKAAFSAS